MLRKRLITLLTFVNGVLHRTKVFSPDYRYTVNFLDLWSVDEIILLDITRRSTTDGMPFGSVIENFAEKCFVPLTAGGGIRNLEAAKLYFESGSDKITINTGAIERPELITEIASAYGSQSTVVSIDARRELDNCYQVYSDFGQTPTGMTPVEWSREAEKSGAGEILLTSIDRDGSLLGYDIELCRQVSKAVNVPVIISGGAGNWRHFIQGYREGGADAVCATNIYHLTEKSIKSFKILLGNNGINVRG